MERRGTVWNGVERRGTVWNAVERVGTVWNGSILLARIFVKTDDLRCFDVLNHCDASAVVDLFDPDLVHQAFYKV